MNLCLVVHLGNLIGLSLFNVGAFEDNNKDIKDITTRTLATVRLEKKEVSLQERRKLTLEQTCPQPSIIWLFN